MPTGSKRGVPIIVDLTTPSRTILGLTTGSADSGQTIIKRSGNGAYARIATVHEANPIQKFSTQDLSLLSLASPEGLAVTGGGELWFQEGLCSSASRQTTGMSGAFTAASLFLNSLQAQQGQDASLEATLHLLSSDGIVNPLIWAPGTLPTPEEASPLYTLGPVNINGAWVEATSVNIDFGVSPMGTQHSGLVFPTCVTADTSEEGSFVPSIQFTSPDLFAATDFQTAASDSMITPITSGVDLFFRLKESNARNYPDASAVHLKISIPLGCITLDSVGGSNSTEAQFSICPTFFSTLIPLLGIDTAAAIALPV